MLFAWFCLSTEHQNPSKINLKSYKISWWNLYRQKMPKYLQKPPQEASKILQNGWRRTVEIEVWDGWSIHEAFKTNFDLKMTPKLFQNCFQKLPDGEKTIWNDPRGFDISIFVIIKPWSRLDQGLIKAWSRLDQGLIKAWSSLDQALIKRWSTDDPHNRNLF